MQKWQRQSGLNKVKASALRRWPVTEAYSLEQTTRLTGGADYAMIDIILTKIAFIVVPSLDDDTLFILYCIYCNMGIGFNEREKKNGSFQFFKSCSTVNCRTDDE